MIFKPNIVPVSMPTDKTTDMYISSFSYEIYEMKHNVWKSPESISKIIFLPLKLLEKNVNLLLLFLFQLFKVSIDFMFSKSSQRTAHLLFCVLPFIIKFQIEMIL